MARKLILVDEEMYRALIHPTPQQKELKDDINLNFMKKNMEGALKKKRKNLSAKNVQYQQELRRYLKAQKEHLDKPIKVQIKNKPSLILKGGPTPSASVVGDDGELEDDIILDENSFLTPKTSLKIPSGAMTPAGKLLEYVSQAPLRFGLNESGSVMRGRKEIKKSDIQIIIRSIFNPTPGSFPPPGYHEFLNKIRDDVFLMN